MKIAKLKLRTTQKPDTILDDYLLEDEGIVFAIFEVATAIECGDLAVALLHTFDQRGKAAVLRDAAISHGVQKYRGAMLRGTSIYIAVLSEYAHLFGANYLNEVLGAPIRDIVSKRARYEMDPCRCTELDDIKVNTENVLAAAEAILTAILHSSKTLPLPIKDLIIKLHRQLNELQPTTAFHVIGSFLFLRFFCPAIVSPETFGLIKDGKLPKETCRGLILVAKILQNVANEVNTFDKEEYLQPTADFVTKWIKEVNTFSTRFLESEAMGEGKLSPRKQRITKESSNQQHTKYLIDYLDKKRSDVLYRLPEPPQKLKFLDIMNDISPYFTVNTPQPPSAITASSPRDDPHSDQSQPGSGKKIWKRVITKISGPISPRSTRGSTFPSPRSGEAAVEVTETAAEQDKKAARHSMDPIDPSLYEYFGDLERTLVGSGSQATKRGLKGPKQEGEESSSSVDDSSEDSKPLSGRKEKKKRKVAPPTPRTDMTMSPRDAPLSPTRRQKPPLWSRRSMIIPLDWASSSSSQDKSGGNKRKGSLLSPGGHLTPSPPLSPLGSPPPSPSSSPTPMSPLSSPTSPSSQWLLMHHINMSARSNRAATTAFEDPRKQPTGVVAGGVSGWKERRTSKEDIKALLHQRRRNRSSTSSNSGTTQRDHQSGADYESDSSNSYISSSLSSSSSYPSSAPSSCSSSPSTSQIRGYVGRGPQVNDENIAEEEAPKVTPETEAATTPPVVPAIVVPQQPQPPSPKKESPTSTSAAGVNTTNNTSTPNSNNENNNSNKKKDSKLKSAESSISLKEIDIPSEVERGDDCGKPPKVDDDAEDSDDEDEDKKKASNGSKLQLQQSEPGRKKKKKRRGDSKKGSRKGRSKQRSRSPKSKQQQLYNIEVTFGDAADDKMTVAIVVDKNPNWEEFVRTVTDRLPPQSAPAAGIAASGKKLKFVFRHPDLGYELKVKSDLTMAWFLKTCGKNVFDEPLPISPAASPRSPRQEKVAAASVLYKLCIKT